MQDSRPPLVTIITLVYNTGKYVVEALESVRAQEYESIQHIIIDDCSSDNSVEIVNNWIKENHYKCDFICHEKNLGITKSVNEGLRKSSGKYITFVSDDLFLPSKLKRQVEIMEGLSDEYGVVYSDIYMRNDDGDDLGTLFTNYRNFKQGPEGDIFEQLFYGNFIHGTATLIRTKCFNEVGYFNEELIVEDIDMYLRIAQKYKFWFDDNISAVYRIHQKSLLQNLGLKGLDQNLRSLEPFCRYNQKTLQHFISYMDYCLNAFYKEFYPGWRHWLKKRIKYKIDFKSIVYYLLAFLNIRYETIRPMKSLLRKVANSLRSQGSIKEEKIGSDNWSSSFKKTSYSQCGEDILIEYVFTLRGIEKPTYLDVGANHPYYLSNTAKFYEKGCRGINIDANPTLIQLFQERRSGDINLNVGISDTEGELDFYIMEDNTLSTFSKEECDSMVANGKILAETRKIKLTTVDKILDENFNGKFPDFLTIDAEGLDFQILKSLNFENSFPKVICVEAAEYSSIGAGERRGELIDFLVEKGYYEYANTNLNAIMVRKDFWFN